MGKYTQLGISGGDGIMAFSVTAVNIDLINNTASVMASDPLTSGPARPAKFIQVSFPFFPSPSVARDTDWAIAEAKKVLQQALEEL